ncbi:hypothetical protein Scep_003612 [Stephania cephalantha]|uniref:Lipoxygenase n=2 Tax=Stephania TaxID=147243 RepID=A0AAP0KSB0_9MAGN
MLSPLHLHNMPLNCHGKPPASYPSKNIPSIAKTRYRVTKSVLQQNLSTNQHAAAPQEAAPPIAAVPKVIQLPPITIDIDGAAVIKAVESAVIDKFKKLPVKCVITVKRIIGSDKESTVDHEDPNNHEMVAGRLRLTLYSTELDRSGREKTVTAYTEKGTRRGEDQLVEFECSFSVPRTFGKVGAVTVQNEQEDETLLVSTIALDGLPSPTTTTTTSLTFNCNSHISPLSQNRDLRIFFSNKSYLPAQTPDGLKRLRDLDLENLRGDGTGERKESDRIYDYDVYNDLADPDSSPYLARPVLGGPEHPYPRRCRTGRGPTKTDKKTEKKSSASYYVPRDEQFSATKSNEFQLNNLRQAVHAVIPTIVSITNPKMGFPFFTAIDSLYNQGLIIPSNGLLSTYLPRVVKFISFGKELLQYETPELITRDRFSWLTDKEFARETLAGLNPYSIQLVKEWPLTSKLDPKLYGPPESAITKELVEKEIGGVMTVEEALEKKRLFMLDYHDLFLPYVNQVRDLGDTYLYGSRTLFFLRDNGTLQPIAIELTRPASNDQKLEPWKQVYTPTSEPTKEWLWKFAKLNVLVQDSAYHQLIAHWLRTHCAAEPFIIAANRQLSAMHPIYRLLHPYFRYTMEINAFARAQLINAGGIIESCFSAGKYSMLFSSVVYDQVWRFDMEALPADLIRRGIAEEDPNAEHGLKLAIQDYPFANDGLILWDAIREWVSDYVNHYYPHTSTIEDDKELQAWWTEVRTVGHGDKKDEPWWPVLNTHENLIQTLSTIIWVNSGHHAAVNFGQYGYAGYFPNRPSVARTKMPDEDPNDDEYTEFLTKPESAMLQCLPSQRQATKVMTILDVLSTHSTDEEYIADKMEPSWEEAPAIKGAFERFRGKVMELTGIIDGRNLDEGLLNRNGAGVVPYELLKPRSESGVTGMGVPNSISI